MFEEGWSIKVGNLADPVKFSNKPKLTHSTAKGGTSFSFDFVGKTFLPWRVTERAKVEVLYSGEQVFVGNILSRSTDWSSLTTSYNALGYYTHTRRNPIIGKFKNPFSTIINQLLDESGARPFINNISYRLGNIADSEASILSVMLERQYTGQYLDACLDDLSKAVGCQWFIQPENGLLVLWQSNQITARGEIDIEAERLGQCQSFKHDTIRPNFIYPEINRVIVAKDSESLLNRNVPQMDSVNNYLIQTNSPTNQIDLLKKTDVVKQYFITPNQPPCNLTINPFSSSFFKEGGSKSFNVMDENDCSWTATSQASWISLTRNTSGNGNGVIEFSVALNPFTKSRSSGILVEGEQNQVRHGVFQQGDEEGIPIGCDAAYFALSSQSPSSSSESLSTNTITFFPRLRPDAFFFTLACSPTSLSPYHVVSSNTIVLRIDLREPTLIGHLLLLHYRINVAVGSHGGNTFPSSGQPQTYIHPGASATAQVRFEALGQVLELEKSLPGGQDGLVQDVASLVSGGFGPTFTGPLPPIDLTPFLGSIVNVRIEGSCTLDSDTRNNPFLESPYDGSLVSGIIQIFCNDFF